jgi:hypothetical protein
MATITINRDGLRVGIPPFEALQALQVGFTIPLSHVRGATDDAQYIADGLGLRSPGTGFPGWIAKGTFRKHKQKVLSLWHRGQQIVVIELANEKWDRVVIGCDDAKALAAQINEAIGG